MINDERLLYFSYAERLKQPNELVPIITSFFHEDATINIVYPFNQMNGPKGYVEYFSFTSARLIAETLSTRRYYYGW